MAPIAALVLAAGRSTRMEGANKLLLPFRGATVIAHTVAAVQAAVDDVLVVTGHEDRQIRDALRDYAVRVVYNPQYRDGIATSIRRGLLAIRPEVEGLLICLGNMPLVAPDTLRHLCRTFAEAQAPAIVIATVEGRRGHPLLFQKAFHDELMALEGDVGGQAVATAHPGAVVEVPVKDRGILQDVDTAATYERLTAEE